MAYIKLEDVIKVCNKYEILHKKENSRLGMAIVNDIYFDIDNLPTADVQEVKHGEWVFSRKEWGSNDYFQDVYYECSNCNKEYEQFDIDEANYCPNCGAKMNGGKKEC